MKTRKGIYQTFEPDRTMSADERWQVVQFDDGAIQIDTETVRLRPFPEPRSEAVTFNLNRDLSPELLTLHGLMGHREGRVNFVDGKALFCWQFKRETHRGEHVWTAGHEIGLDSALFDAVIAWRSALEPGQERMFQMARLDPLTFAPQFDERSLARLADEWHETRFGARQLRHFAERSQAGDAISEFWCDADGVVFELRESSGRAIVLTGVNA